MKQYCVDAFTDSVFHGNQAAVCVLDRWPDDSLMLDIARENNFSETAFTVKREDGYDLRWFTPGGEIDLCGHATLGTSFVLFRFYEKDSQELVFHTLSGDLFIRRNGDYIEMDLPAYELRMIPVTDEMESIAGIRPKEAYLDRDLLLVYEDEDVIRNMSPDMEKVEALPGLCLGVTARGREHDCVSRFFAPKLSIAEDPVTGSVHAMIVPYWAKVLGKTRIHAYQASERGGELLCEDRGDRVMVSGKAVLYAVSELAVSI